MAPLLFKPSTDGTNKPVTQPVIQDNVFRMTTKDRLCLGRGPTFAIQLGDTVVAEQVPKRSAMAMSTFFNDALTKHPQSSGIMINAEQADERPLRILADYITSNSKTTNPFALRVPEALVELVNLYRHTHILGMEPHARGLRAKILEYLAAKPSVSFVALDELAKLPTADRCYQVAVGKIEGLIYIGAIKTNGMDWRAWANNHADFMAAVATFKANRVAASVENRARQQEAMEAQKAKDWADSFPPLV